jgi:hypothetical protein
MNAATFSDGGADRLLLNRKRQKLDGCRPCGVGVGLVKPALDVGVDPHVARVAERQHVVEGVVPLLLRVSKAPVVDVMDVRGVGVAAKTTLEIIALQCLKVIPVTVLSDQLGVEGTPLGTVKVSGPGALDHGSANPARKLNAALRAGLGLHVARVKLITAAVTRLGVKFGLRVFVAKLANFATHLELMVSTKFRRTDVAVSVSKRSFGHTELYLIGGA